MDKHIQDLRTLWDYFIDGHYGLEGNPQSFNEYLEKVVGINNDTVEGIINYEIKNCGTQPVDSLKRIEPKLKFLFDNQSNKFEKLRHLLDKAKDFIAYGDVDTEDLQRAEELKSEIINELEKLKIK